MRELTIGAVGLVTHLFGRAALAAAACSVFLSLSAVPSLAVQCSDTEKSATLGTKECTNPPAADPIDVDAALEMLDPKASAKTRELGLTLLRKAADAGDVRATVSLATIYREGGFGVPVDQSRAAVLYGEAAAKGDNFSRVQLALMLLDGLGLPLDVDRAVGLLEDASATDDAWSTTILASLYINGDKVPADGERAMALLAPLVKADNPSAFTSMGDLYSSGPEPVKADPARAVEFYEQAVALNDIAGKSRLGTILVGRKGETADVARGLTLLEDVAGAGDNWTLIQIGNIHAAGEVVPLNAGKALAYYERAAEAGLAAGYSLMGNVYKFGLGSIGRDTARAAGFYEQALVGKDNAARVQLALMLLDGTSLPLDVTRAVGLLEDANATGDVWSTTILAGLYTDGGKVPADGKRAIALLAPLVEINNAAALTAMGDVYAKGPAPVKVDADRALEFFERAAVLGDIGGKSRLGTILVGRKDKPKDVARGLALLEDVANAGDNWTLIQIGNLYAAGESVQLDAGKALAYYERAAKAGLAAGYSLIGNAYNYGLGTLRKDPKRAASYYEKAVAGKENTGRVQLALMLLDGTSLPLDVDRAVDLLKDAAATGDLWSTTILANLYAEGRLVPAQYSKARSYYDAAYAMGNRDAVLQFGLALATGPLAEKHAKEGVQLVRSAVEKGIASAALHYARLQVAGRVPGDNANDASSTLRKAVAAGDAASLRYLVELYRDGVPGQIAPRPKEAKQLLERHGQLLAPEDRALDTILVMARRSLNPSRLERIGAEFGKLRPEDVTRTLRFLLGSDPNAYVYVLQRQLGADRIYRGPLDGTLTSLTIRAIGAMCRRLGAAEVCRRGVLTAEAADVLANWLMDMTTRQN